MALNELLFREQFVYWQGCGWIVCRPVIASNFIASFTGILIEVRASPNQATPKSGSLS